MRNDAERGRSWLLATTLSAGLCALHCGGQSSGDDKGGTSAGSAGTHAGQVGGGSGGSGASGGSAGRANVGDGGLSSANGGRGASAGSGQTSGAAGTGATTGGTGGAGASGGQAGHNTGGAAGKAGTSGTSGTGGDTGAQGGAAGESGCASPADCQGGPCWQGLDGVGSCVMDPPRQLAECFQPDDPSCCTLDSDCSDSGAAICVANVDTTLSCGGAFPAGNSCQLDTCADDSDCTDGPAGATVATCAPRGALGLFTAACVYGGCRTNADCTLHPDGECLYDLAATHNGCDLHYVLFCAYPSDPCTARYGSCDNPVQVCAPNDDYQGRSCVQAPPMYP